MAAASYSAVLGNEQSNGRTNSKLAAADHTIFRHKKILINTTMQAAVVTAVGQPLALQEWPIPKPGPGQVLVAINTVLQRLQDPQVPSRVVLEFAA